MDIGQLNAEIDSVQRDLKSLNQEIDPLSVQFDTLKEELRLLEESVDENENENEQDQHRHRHHKSKGHDYDETIPPLVQHSHFDDSIAKFFMNDDQEEVIDDQPYKKQKLNDLSNNILAKADGTVELKENLLYENVFRFGGITAFPINKFLFNDDDEVLGLRFDIFSHFRKQYLKPHYIILKKVDRRNKQNVYDSLKWSVYRHTVPVYVALEEYDEHLLVENEQSGLNAFASSVRDQLIQIQYKHDKLDFCQQISLESLDNDVDSSSRKVIKKIEKDLECRRVIIYIKSRFSIGKNTNHELQLTCSDSSIDTVYLLLLNKQDILYEKQAIYAESVLRGSSFKDLIKKLRIVFEYLHKEQII